MTPHSPTWRWLLPALIAVLLPMLAQAQASSRDPARARQLHEEAVKLADAYDMSGALAKIREAVSFDPDDAGYHHLYGKLLYRDGRYRDAVVELKEAIRLDKEPPNAEYRSDLGHSLVMVDRLSEAIPVLREAVRLAPDNHEDLGWLGDAELKTGDTASAVADLKKATVLEPRSAMYLFQYAGALAKAGDHAAASTAYETAIRRNNNNYVWLYEYNEYRAKRGLPNWDPQATTVAAASSAPAMPAAPPAPAPKQAAVPAPAPAPMPAPAPAPVMAAAAPASAAPPAAAPAAGSVSVTVSLDAPNRSLRVQPMNLTIRLPDAIAVESFSAPHPNWASLIARLGGGLLFFIDLHFVLDGKPGNCDSWDARVNKTRRGPSDKGGPSFDPRWVGYLSNTDKINTCLAVPGGTVTIEGSELDKMQKGPFVQLTASIADAFLPATAQARTAAAAPAPPALISIDDVYPESIISAAEFCNMGYELQCMAVEAFRPVQNNCRNGFAKSCAGIAKMALDSKDKDYLTASIYYRRACQIGDTSSCKLADKYAKMAGQ